MRGRPRSDVLGARVDVVRRRDSGRPQRGAGPCTAGMGDAAGCPMSRFSAAGRWWQVREKALPVRCALSHDGRLLGLVRYRPAGRGAGREQTLGRRRAGGAPGPSAAREDERPASAAGSARFASPPPGGDRPSGLRRRGRATGSYVWGSDQSALIRRLGAAILRGRDSEHRPAPHPPVRGMSSFGLSCVSVGGGSPGLGGVGPARRVNPARRLMGRRYEGRPLRGLAAPPRARWSLWATLRVEDRTAAGGAGTRAGGSP
ncbi:hypothetical protein DFJ69_6063 [Thermomonospora umbrina]|uniref:Uncharacterized protein n=1 Tax=Thermomonospora umbrina TaxID=111806 RepID=A0A3D9SXE6_9ACTN|nr:hypothetical protein DFJ69_6063 [Thermomonospora umbrina]